MESFCVGLICLIIQYHGAIAWTTRAKALSNRHAPLFSSDAVAQQNEPFSKSVDELIGLGRSELHQFFNFPLDDWQLHAGGAICAGCNVIVCAPTGAGKTVVGEMALFHAATKKQSGIYTTPLKALSNQKYSDLCQLFGRQSTGLSTGDVSINKGALVTVMTTEVYRNIAWRSSTPSTTVLGTNDLTQNAVVVLDEFHYMGNPGRGGVWEESVITSPPHTQIVGLSATLANGQELASWMESVTGRRTVLVEVPGRDRPVPLRFIFATKKGLYPLFRDPDAGPGAPKGLLGLRGDGVASQAKSNQKKQKTKGFGDGAAAAQKGLPTGLQVNPALRAAARERLNKVTRTLERRRRVDTFRSVGKDASFDAPRKRKLSPREERRERDRLLRNEMRREVPALPVLLSRLSQKDLLPAIFFIFSRAGCDDAAQNAYQAMRGPKRDPNRMLDEEFEQFDVEPVHKKQRKQQQKKGRRRGKGSAEDGDGRVFRAESNYVSEDVLNSYLDDSAVSVSEEAFEDGSPLSPENWEYCSKAGLLDLHQVREVASRISVFNEQNPEIAFDTETAEQFMFGIGSHHAGLLPAHKSFIETLFRRQLMLAVFATETLAAGINMPARTCCICSMAKRGSGSSMNLLETSNLLQMAGRAGRRGFDTAGTCVIAATPFESHDEAIKILTDPVKPIESQFTPSYSLAVNLIARGEGRLKVARQLVNKSFAAWTKRRAEETAAAVKGETNGEGVNDLLHMSNQERFMTTLVETLQFQVDGGRSVSFDIGKLKQLLDILQNREVLKKTSKSYTSLSKVAEMESTTLRYLEMEAEQLHQTTGKNLTELEALVKEEDLADMVNHIAQQRKRTKEAEMNVAKHPFSVMAEIAQEIISNAASPEGVLLGAALAGARRMTASGAMPPPPLSASELTVFAKSAVQKKKSRLDPSLVVKNQYTTEIQPEDSSWDDMMAITKTLLAYGCVTTTPTSMDDAADDDVDDQYSTIIDEDDATTLEEAQFTLTQAGNNVGMLGFENTLWVLVAVGGAWCVKDETRSDLIQDAIDSWDDNDDDGDDTNGNDEQQQASAMEEEEEQDDDPSSLLLKRKPLREAEELLSRLQAMSAAEFAGYIAAIVSENSRSSVQQGNDLLDQFRNLTPNQQGVIQSALASQDRLVEVQTLYGVDDSSSSCNLDITNMAVVTAWADGCTWSEALSLAGGLPPGDLVRTLSRVLDAVRQLGNLPYRPVRGTTTTTLEVGGGIHPTVRRMCRDAADAINRYPVKDPLAFATPPESEDSDDNEDDKENI